MKSLILALSICSLAFGATLDQVMPKDVQKRTGVDKLSAKEQAALAEYITQVKEEHVPATAPSTIDSQDGQNPDAPKLSMRENLQGGKLLKLSDGSIWQVDPNDLNISRIWLFPFDVEITQDPYSHAYPYKMKNLSTGTVINVRKL